MSRRAPRPWLAWLALLVWGAWLHAGVGRLAAEPALGGWVPDVGLVLLLALAPRLTRPEVRGVALVVALTRLAFTADAAVAVFAGVIAAVALSRGLAAFVDVDGVVVRGVLAGASALFAGGLAALAHLARSEAGLAGAGVPLATEPVLRGAVATAAAAALIGPGLRRLPGVSPFAEHRRRGFA